MQKHIPEYLTGAGIRQNGGGDMVSPPPLLKIWTKMFYFFSV